MAFVQSEQPRESTFLHPPSYQAVGPNLGPGTYNFPDPRSSQSLEKQQSLLAPFGTSQRRRLNMPHLEMLQDLAQFRIIPDFKQIHAQAHFEESVERKKVNQIPKKTITTGNLNRTSVNQSKTSLIEESNNQKNLVNNDPYKYQRLSFETKPKKKRRKYDLARVMGLMNVTNLQRNTMPTI